MSANPTDKPLPCPFCDSTEITTNEWYLDEEGTVDAYECRQCYAGAPARSWNQRSSDA